MDTCPAIGEKGQILQKAADSFPTLKGHLVALYFIIMYYTGSDLPQDGSVSWFIDSYQVYADVPRWISLTVYLVASRQLVIRSEQSSPATRKLARFHRRLRQIINAFLVVQAAWLALLVPYVIPKYTGWVLDNIGWLPVYIPLAILIQTIVTYGYLSGKQQSDGKIKLFVEEEAFSRASAFAAVTAPAGSFGASTSDRATVGSGPVSVVDIAAAIQRAMEIEKLYLDPRLDVNLLATHVGCSPKFISSVLNNHIGSSFNTFVNYFRVEEVKRRLSSADCRHLTILGIGLECGFNSGATFQRCFKQLADMSPSEYRALVFLDEHN